MKLNEENNIVQLTLRLPKELNEYFQTISLKKGISKNSLIVAALWDFEERGKQC